MIRFFAPVGLAIFFSVMTIWTAAAEMVVIASSAPEIQGGQIVQDGAAITVPAGSSVTLVSAAGEALTIDGPFSGVPAGGGGGDNSLVLSLSGLLSPGGSNSASMGVMRSGIVKKPTDPWVVNIERSGKQCVRAGATTELWRSDSVDGATLKIKNMSSKEQSETQWPAGSEKLSWPSGSALNDGDQYLLRKKGGRTAKKITLFVMPNDLPSAAHQAIWMAGKGCTIQAKLLLETLK